MVHLNHRTVFTIIIILYIGGVPGADHQKKPSSCHEILDANLQEVCLRSGPAQGTEVCDRLKILTSTYCRQTRNIDNIEL